MNLQANRSASNIPPIPNNVPKPSVSLVICTCNRADNLKQCLDAVAKLSPSADEVLVVDNTLGDPAARSVSESAGVRYLVEPSPGLSRARNRAMAESACEIVAFVDDDALPQSDWLAHILAPFADSQVAAVTGETVGPGATGQPGPSRVVSKAVPRWFEIANFGGLGYGTNMAIRKNLRPAATFFDVRLGRGAPIWIAEENYAFAQLIAAGYTAVHVPAALVVHPVKRRNIPDEATISFAYWLLLFFEFSGHRRDLISFLSRRLRRKPLTWPRDPDGPGEIMSSGWRLKLKAAIAGLALYLKTRNLRGH